MLRLRKGSSPNGSLKVYLISEIKRRYKSMGGCDTSVCFRKVMVFGSLWFLFNSLIRIMYKLCACVFYTKIRFLQLGFLQVTNTLFVLAHKPALCPWISNISSISHKLTFRAFGCCALPWCTATPGSPFFYDWRNDRCANLFLSHLSSAHHDWMRSCQCWRRSAKLREYLRHVCSLLSCVVETVMSAETVPQHLREYLYFIYMTFHISAFETEGCIT